MGKQFYNCRADTSTEIMIRIIFSRFAKGQENMGGEYSKLDKTLCTTYMILYEWNALEWEEEEKRRAMKEETVIKSFKACFFD